MNQTRKCCILVDDAFVRSPLGIIKFISIWCTLGGLILFWLAAPPERRTELTFFVFMFVNSFTALVTLLSYAVKCMSCLNYDGRGRYLEAIWHALMAIFQFLALALFYFGSFLGPGYIPGIKHWPLPDDDDRKLVFQVCFILILISCTLSFMYLFQFCCSSCYKQRYELNTMQSFAPPSGIPPYHLRPKSDDQITHIEEILDNNPGPSMYYPAHLPGDTLSSKARASLLTSNWDLIPVQQTPVLKPMSTQTEVTSINESTNHVTQNISAKDHQNSGQNSILNHFTKSSTPVNHSNGISNAAYTSSDGSYVSFKDDENVLVMNAK